MPQNDSAGRDGPEALDAICRQMRQVYLLPEIRTKAFGVPDLDWQLWKMGREWLERRPDDAAVSSIPGMGPDVYLATQVYAHGGHTALIGDFVQALGSAVPPHLIVTDFHGQHGSHMPGEIHDRTRIAPGNLHLLAGPTVHERMEQLFAKLLELRPRRLFLFHHPDDPLACLIAQPQLAGQIVLVHHADSIPSFGLHLPGIRLIELNPVAAAMSRLQGFSPALLPLTCPDPGPRSVPFLQSGHLVTATCGSQSKYVGPHPYGYPETVGVILRSTQGRHVHFGPLDEALQWRIRNVLEKEQVAPERFTHVPWVPSLASALWDHGCDVYFSSFPITGARVNAEVMASATPHLRHSSRPSTDLERIEMSLQGGLVWNTWEDLSATLLKLADPRLLEQKARSLRHAYEEIHHPKAFATHLAGILEGKRGFLDPHQAERDPIILASTVKSLTGALIRVGGELEHERLRTDFLMKQRQQFKDKIRGLEEKWDGWKNGTGLKARLRRWLMRP